MPLIAKLTQCNITGDPTLFIHMTPNVRFVSSVTTVTFLPREKILPHDKIVYLEKKVVSCEKELCSEKESFTLTLVG